MICPNCKKRISKDDKFCGYCGLILKKEILEEKLVEEKKFSFKQPIFHLVFLYIFTFGLYGIYWFYKTWKQIKEHTKDSFSPGWRTVGLFIPFYNIWRVYTLFNNIKILRLKADFVENPSPGWLTFLYFLFTYLTSRLPDPWYLIGLLSLLPLVFAQKALNELWGQEQKDRREKTKFSTKEIIVLIIGGIIIAFVLWGTFIEENEYSLKEGFGLFSEETRPISKLPPGTLPERFFQSQPLGNQISKFGVNRELMNNLSAVVIIACPDDYDSESWIIGSGVIIDPSGIIVTNYHLLLNTTSYYCTIGITKGISDPPEFVYYADYFFVDPETGKELEILNPDIDIAFLQIVETVDGTRLPHTFPTVSRLGSSESLNINNKVYILGYPEFGGDTITVTEGIISGRVGKDLIKISAKIDAGNSGGAAINEGGEFVGIPTLGIKGEFEGLGYIIGVDSIRNWLNQLK